MKNIGNLLLLILGASVSACSSVKDDAGQDPLKNTRSYMDKEHPALYKEGALQVPMTTIHLIPPGPSTLGLASEMAGLGARQSAEESLTHAREALGLIRTGVTKSVEAAAAVNQGTNQVAAAPHAAIPFGLEVASAAPDVRTRIAGASATYAEETRAGVEATGKNMADGALGARDRIVADSARHAEETRASVEAAGKNMADDALEERRRIVNASSAHADATKTSLQAASASAVENGEQTGRALSHSADERAAAVWEGGSAKASRVSQTSAAAGKRNVVYAYERFCKGWGAVPDKTGKHYDAVAESLLFKNFVEAIRRSNESRNRQSAMLIGTMSDTTASYADNVGKAFDAANEEVTPEGKKKSGPVLAALNYLGLRAKGIIWDASIKPGGKLAGAAVGWVGTNFGVFPVMVVAREGAAVTNVAVQVAWNVAGEAYDVTAPTVGAAVAGLFGVVEAAGGQAVALGELTGGAAGAAGTYGGRKLAAGAAYAGGGLAGAVLYVAAPISSLGIQAGGEVAGAAVAGSGWAAGKAVQHVGAPLSFGAVRGSGEVVGDVVGGSGWVAGKTVQHAGAPVASAAIQAGGQVGGAAAATTTAVGGLGIAVAGGATELATQAAGKTTAAVIGVGGSAISVAGGGALGAYEMAKMYVVPTAHVMGSGLVLGYGTLSQLGAQAVYYAGDATYMVLSLEGERWVVYAVKGVLDRGDHLPPGAMLDLNAMQKAGETFYAVPVSDEEMARMVKAVPADLPVRATPSDSAAVAAP